MHPVSRAVLALLLGSVAALGPASVALAAGSGTVTTAPEAEAWYRAAQSCVLTNSCAPTPPSPYSADTLHVGVLAGQEEARTFLQLDLGGLPPGTKPAGGQLRLPVASGGQDGSRSPQTAKFRACLVNEPVEDADGDVGTGPEVDCGAAATEAEFVAATERSPAAFTVDLSDLASAWTASAAPGALALLPAKDVGPTDSWHVAFSDRTRKGDSVARITAAVSYVSASVDVQEQPPAPVTAPVEAPFAPPPAFGSENVFSVPGAALQAPPSLLPVQTEPQPAAAPPPQAASQQVVPVASFADAGFRYPAAFLLPLLFAVAAGWLGRALTRDLAADSFG